MDWYNKKGFCGFGKNKGIHKETGTLYNQEGYNNEGYNKNGFNYWGFNIKLFNKKGIHKETGTKYNQDGKDINGWDKEGYNDLFEHKDGYTFADVLNLLVVQ